MTQWDDWANCFTDDAVVEMPFGTHIGREGLGRWAADALASFEATVHLSANLEVELQGDEAIGTSNIWAACVSREDAPDQHFDGGGYYLRGASVALTSAGGSAINNWPSFGPPGLMPRASGRGRTRRFAPGAVECRAREEPTHGSGGRSKDGGDRPPIRMEGMNRQ
jgi:hypothetical protein